MYEKISVFKNHEPEIKFNLGIQLLRIILSYFILQLHCYNFKKTKNFILIKSFQGNGFYVPTFFIISYYFSYKTFFLKNINRIERRLQRIIIPYTIWPMIFFLRNKICNFYVKKKNTFNDLFIQLITGKRIHGVFWFQCNLILSYILFSIITLSLKNNFLFIIQLIGIGGYYYYSIHYYNNLFYIYIYEIRSLIQDYSKTLFFGSIGISIASITDINILKLYRKRTIFFTLLILYQIKDFYIIKNQFFYLKIILYGIGGVSFFFLFSVLPLENISKIFLFIIMNISNYTGGVYYLHTKIRDILSSKIKVIKNKTLKGSLLVYIISYFICLFGMKIFKKTKLKYLFI